jgi:O-methyltransferase domain/Dimerisation domain
MVTLSQSNTVELPKIAEHVVVGIAMGYAGSQILFNAEELGIFELLSDGSQELETLAGKAGIRPPALEKLLIGCCALGLLTRDGRAFDLTEVSRACLVKSGPVYMGGLFPFFKRALYPVWEHLDSGLREEAAQWKRVPSIGEAGLFEALYHDQRSLMEFHQATYQMSFVTGMMAAQKIDFSLYRRAIDVGGGTGGFLAALCGVNPNVEGIVFDLPLMEAAANGTFERSGLAGRIQFIAGDFFVDPLPDGDLYVLGDVLHDWTREEGTTILEKVYAALPPGGAVLIAESLLNDRKDGPYLPAVMNLTTLLTTKGEHHSAAEFEAWLSEVGFARFDHFLLSGSPRDIFVGWKY